MNWTDAKKKTPEGGKFIVVSSREHYPNIFYGFFDNEGWPGIGENNDNWNNEYFVIANGNGKYFKWSDIDYWMRLPALPKQMKKGIQ